MNCIFCDILDGKNYAHFLYKDEFHVAFLDTCPINVGHSLVIPREHHERITDMSPENVGRIFAIAPKIAQAVLDATGADSFSLGQNNGEAAKQTVLHVHIHIIPAYAGTHTDWKRRLEPEHDELVTLAKKIRHCLT